MARFTSIMKESDNLMGHIESYLRIHNGSVLPDSSFDRFTDKLAEVLKCKKSIIGISCLCIKDIPVSEESIYKLVWRLCANRDRLRSGYPILCYPKFSFSGVEEIRFDSTVRKGEKYKTVLRVLTGHYALGTFTCEFSYRGSLRILSLCGYHGRDYVVSRIEDCLPGLYAKAHLLSSSEDSRIFKDIEVNEGICAFNRKYVIGPRVGKVTCPKSRRCPCRKCEESPKVCLASYKEWSYYD